MSKYSQEMVEMYGTIGRLRKLTTEKKQQEKLKQTEENLKKVLMGKFKRKRRYKNDRKIKFL